MCLFNKIVKSEQIIVIFQVDNLKVSHKDQAVLKNSFDELRNEFVQKDELFKNREHIHKYLGITIDYSIADKVVFSMFDFLTDVIVKYAEDLKNSCSYYPGKNQLFKLVEDSLRLPSTPTLQDYYLQTRR